MMSDLVLVELLGRFQMSTGRRRMEGIHSARLESLVAYLVFRQERGIDAIKNMSCRFETSPRG